MLTAYDAPQARAQQQAGIDAILVGDSVGVNILGYSSEREVTLADMAHHTRAVRRGAPDTFVIADLPFATYDTPEQAVASAKFLQQAGADAVKFEGAHPELVQALGRRPAFRSAAISAMSRSIANGASTARPSRKPAQIFADARALDEAGVFMLVIELAPGGTGRRRDHGRSRPPTIGIGAGPATDGQVLVFPDVLGYIEKNFRHNRRYAEVGATMREAAAAYLRDVRARDFPDAGQRLGHAGRGFGAIRGGNPRKARLREIPSLQTAHFKPLLGPGASPSSRRSARTDNGCPAAPARLRGGAARKRPGGRSGRCRNWSRRTATCGFRRHWPAGRGIDRETVVHRDDLDLVGREILDRMIGAVMALSHFHRLGADRERHHLMAEADAEGRHLAPPGSCGWSARRICRSPPDRRGRWTGRPHRA